MTQDEGERRDPEAGGLHLAALVNASNDAIISADADGMITTWNRAAETLYGYSEQEIIGRSLTELCPVAKRAEQRRLLRAVARGAVRIEVETQRLHKDGSLLEVSVTDSRIMEAGSLRGFCAVTHDIGKRVRSRARLEARVREQTHDLVRSRAETLRRLALAAEYRDDDTAPHAERVGARAARIAVELGLRAPLVDRIGEAAPLHDVGKIGIPDSILLKRGPLTTAESDTMRQHTILGARILAGSDGEVLRLAEQIALTHHEHWDGNGYPAGLTGEEIPFAGRIVAVADAFDAMTHERPYGPAVTIEVALTEISRCSGSQFDPLVVAALQRLSGGEFPAEISLSPLAEANLGSAGCGQDPPLALSAR
jgi:putative two-component system response regulator